MPSQIMALRYLRQQLNRTFSKFYLTGHTKGANLSAFTAQQLNEYQAERIKALYLFDRPGFDSKSKYLNHQSSKLIKFTTMSPIIQ